MTALHIESLGEGKAGKYALRTLLMIDRVVKLLSSYAKMMMCLCLFAYVQEAQHDRHRELLYLKL